MDLVEITAPDFDVEFEIAYATANNLTGEPIYRRAACYLHGDAAKLLGRAIALAAEIGLRLKVFDAFRPVEAQWVLWNHTPDPEFLADPRKGSPHSRGVAIDLTLIDGTGTPLEMGTEFDAFTPDAHHGVTNVSVKAQGNRYSLLGLMMAAGWDFYRNEWWHYQMFDAKRYPLIGEEELPAGMM